MVRLHRFIMLSFILFLFVSRATRFLMPSNNYVERTMIIDHSKNKSEKNCALIQLILSDPEAPDTKTLIKNLNEWIKEHNNLYDLDIIRNSDFDNK